VPTKQQFMALSNFRHRLSSFVRFSTTAARSAGLTMTQYLLLLHVMGRPGREWATVGELAECLQASPHGTVALVDRCAALGLVERRSSAEDARRVEVHLTAKGRRLVERIASLHRNALQSFRDVFRVVNVNDLPLGPDPVDAHSAARPAAGDGAPRAQKPRQTRRAGSMAASRRGDAPSPP
jgi:DNA-binding MarR family transcriptional regulator